MTPFRFRLQRVLDFRNVQFQLAESEYQRASAKVRSIQAQQATLAYRKSETRKSFVKLPEVSGRDIAPLSGWLRWTEGRRTLLAGMEQAAMQEVAKRRTILTEAQRKVQLLEKLRDRRKGEWQTAFDRELEEQAADAFRAGLGRTSGRYGAATPGRGR